MDYRAGTLASRHPIGKPQQTIGGVIRQHTL